MDIMRNLFPCRLQNQQPAVRITDEKHILRKIPTPRIFILDTHPPKEEDGNVARGSEENPLNIRKLMDGLKNARRQGELE